MVRHTLTYPVPEWFHQPPSTEDLLVFLIILYLASWSTIRQSSIPVLLDTIVRDATEYFFVIFMAHFVLVMTLLFARVNSTIFVNYDDAERLL